MVFSTLFSELYHSIKKTPNSGEVAQYIPELALVDPNKFGVSLVKLNAENFHFGDAQEKFSIQSIAKVLSLTLAYKICGEKLWERVGVEPSGTAFNSLVQLEYEKGIPRNPFINAGALVVADVLVSELKNPNDDFLAFVNQLCHTQVSYSKQVAASEKSCAYVNTALINLMKSFGNIKNDIDQVMDLYFNLCSIEMTCQELSQTFLFLANDGVCPLSEQEIIDHSKSKRINSIMQLCGFYDEAGEFSFKVGLPGKSGVGGGIVVVRPHEFSMAVWSPKLNAKGNSFLGTKFLEKFTTKIDYSIF
ncbi:glutaminase [Aquimarina agarivorans]|uniref:glutaminase n=1 Tax=Aquimarina agarivorans TaxID=980584 RepID=UPI000248E63C|nr:glutaminase [Aquimarina agarivorans]